MGRDSGGDTGDAIYICDHLSDGYKVQYVLMCGYHILDPNDKPITGFWLETKRVAEMLLAQIREIIELKNKITQLKAAKNQLQQELFMRPER